MALLTSGQASEPENSEHGGFRRRKSEASLHVLGIDGYKASPTAGYAVCKIRWYTIQVHGASAGHLVSQSR